MWMALDIFGERVEKKTSPEEDEAPAETEEGAVDDVALLEPWLVSRDAGEGTDTLRIKNFPEMAVGTKVPSVNGGSNGKEAVVRDSFPFPYVLPFPYVYVPIGLAPPI